MRDAASEAQVRAADPSSSTWLSANAGSGKTRVLIDRVARLLLQGTPPQRILCLTYTNAAASEMQNRLFKRLGEWAMMPEAQLVAALDELGTGTPDLAEARRLFARAIETPGGLRIQTIHSFCASLLRRFPLEAGVSPGFTEIDEITRRQLIRDVLDQMAEDTGEGALRGFVAAMGDGEALRLVERLADLRRDLVVDDRESIFAAQGLAADLTIGDLNRQALSGLPRGWQADVVASLSRSSTNDQKVAVALAATALAEENAGMLAALESALLFGGGAKAAYQPKLPTQGWVKANPALSETFSDLAERVAELRPQRLALKSAEEAAALAEFARAFLPRFAEAKARRGWLDFDDLIERAEGLVTHPDVAAWVLFRLDGGIDHILVDEAQDTSPAQWRVIDLLTQEFTAGLGARGERRTLFVVGDKKQSIYSFQGADVSGFDARSGQFQRAFTTAGLAFATRDLQHSFRSSPQILALVDAVFGDRYPKALGDAVHHIAFHAGLPGRVELWAPVPKPEKEKDEGHWADPVDQVSPQDPPVVLAERLAARIGQMIGRTPVPLSTGGCRPARAGDFLILVRRRSGVFHHLIRACKAAGLPVAGSDRLKLAEELAVRDLLALLSVLAVPEDDLALAAVLRSPLCGWSEAELFDLAHGRSGYLWEALRARADSPALALLQDLRDQADFLRPHDLLDRALTRHHGRRRLLARLGEEVAESIDALLAQALAYEQVEVPSLDGFLGWMQAEDATIKRQLGEAADRIRIMTVHGAKGLEGEIVILPDTNDRPPHKDKAILLDEAGRAFSTGVAGERSVLVDGLMQARQARAEEESLRLLYVALTRARTQLIVAAAGDAGPSSWHGLVQAAMQDLGAETEDGRLVLQDAAWPNDYQPDGTTPANVPRAGGALPDWWQVKVPAAKPRVLPLSPSKLGGAKALPGAGAEAEADTGADATERGTALHLLLQHLPGRAEPHWPMLAKALIPSADLCAECLGIAARLIRDPALASVFGPDSLAEVPVLGSLGGQVAEGVIDRLVVTEGEVWAVDFKSNRILPAGPEETPEALLRQMGAYAAMLAPAFPGRAIRTAILWTETGWLMPLDDEIVRAALARATTLGSPAAPGGLDVGAGHP